MQIVKAIPCKNKSWWRWCCFMMMMMMFHHDDDDDDDDETHVLARHVYLNKMKTKQIKARNLRKEFQQAVQAAFLCWNPTPVWGSSSCFFWRSSWCLGCLSLGLSMRESHARILPIYCMHQGNTLNLMPDFVVPTSNAMELHDGSVPITWRTLNRFASLQSWKKYKLIPLTPFEPFWTTRVLNEQ